MAVVRFLKGFAACGLAAALVVFPVHSQPVPSAPIPLPRWVRLAKTFQRTYEAEEKAEQLVDNWDRKTPLQVAFEVGDLAISVRELYRGNRTLLGGGRVPGPFRMRLLRFAVLDGATTAYDLYQGNITTSEAGRNMVALGASSVAGSLAAGGMLWIAGAVGTASTGTAISTLSGAAFTSAATAYWGGGALAAGGGGMAAGTVVLTGGAVVAVAATTYAVYKLWNIYDPAERRAMDDMVGRMIEKDDLTDAGTPYGAMLIAERARIEKAIRDRERQR